MESMDTSFDINKDAHSSEGPSLLCVTRTALEPQYFIPLNYSYICTVDMTKSKSALIMY